jgi:hypothetical protein
MLFQRETHHHAISGIGGYESNSLGEVVPIDEATIGGMGSLAIELTVVLSTRVASKRTGPLVGRLALVALTPCLPANDASY